MSMRGGTPHPSNRTTTSFCKKNVGFPKDGILFTGQIEIGTLVADGSIPAPRRITSSFLVQSAHLAP